MKSKIRVEYDFDKKEPYLQFYLEKETEDQPDLRDSMLKNLIQSANSEPVCVWYPPHNTDNSVPQLRLQDPHSFVTFMEDWCLSKFNDGDKFRFIAVDDPLKITVKEISEFFGKMTHLLK